MKILAEKLEKKFRKECIFSNFSYEFENGKAYAITGPNGSGKSSLLKILSFYSLPTKGSLSLIDSENTIIATDKTYQSITFAAPYMQLIEEFTLLELLEFAGKTNLIEASITENFFENYIELKPGRDKLINQYSSGMRQKIKLGLAMLSNRPILLLDEPCTNLDRQAKDWFFKKLQSQQEKMIIIASNEKEEIDFCQSQISIVDYKK
jgi:ABC-type multidrug transport system ATPase subunit